MLHVVKNMKKSLFLLVILLLGFSFILKAKPPDNNLWSWLIQKKSSSSKKYISFNRLKFAYEDKQVSCNLDNNHKLLCKINNLAELIFEEKNISSSKALALVRLARKENWHKQYKLINQYVEGQINTGSGLLALQQIIIYNLDNILWPVLIRAYDVVIDEHTCISITTKCGFRDWPAIEKEISSIEASLSKSTY